MQKEYLAVKITNPAIQGHLVKLYPNQKVILLLNDCSSEINIQSDFLILEKREIVDSQLVCVFSQKNPNFHLKTASLFLGEIYIYSQLNTSSLCLFLSESGIHYNSICVINPNKQVCRFNPDQILDVYFLNKNIKNYCIIPGLHFKLINSLADYSNKDQYFRFQLDFSKNNALPNGKYESGSIVFYGLETYQFNLILNWNKKIYPINYRYRQAMRSNVIINKKLTTDLEFGCKYVFGN